MQIHAIKYLIDIDFNELNICLFFKLYKIKYAMKITNEIKLSLFIKGLMIEIF